MRGCGYCALKFGCTSVMSSSRVQRVAGKKQNKLVTLNQIFLCGAVLTAQESMGCWVVPTRILVEGGKGRLEELQISCKKMKNDDVHPQTKLPSLYKDCTKHALRASTE